MNREFQKKIALLISFILLFTFSTVQLVNAQDIDIYNSIDVQKYTTESLEGTKPNINDANFKNIDVINGTVKFTSIISSGAKYDILRSDNGGQYTKLTDFPLSNLAFEDKYILSGHTYYYIVVAYDATGAVLNNIGPFKAVTKESASTSSKTIVLQLDNQYAYVGGVKHTLDVKPFIKDGRTMVPLRFISEALGAQVAWSQNEQKITINYNGSTIILWIGKSETKVNNNTVFMDVPAMVSNSRTLIPIRFVSEKLNLIVDFKNDTKQITLSDSQAAKQQPAVTPTPQPTNTSESILRGLVKSGKKYLGESFQGYVGTKYSITFSDYNEQTGEFKGKIEWIGFNVIDDISGKVDGDKLVFKQTTRYQNNTSAPLDAVVTMKLESYKRVSGTWSDAQTGNTGTTWFEFTPQTATQAKYTGSIDANGFPTGKTTLEFGNNVKFVGEVKVEAMNHIAIGVITYPDGTKVIGRFVNGKPDGLSSIIYPNKQAYLVDFFYGKPIKYFAANTIPVYNANEIEIYKANNIEIFKADTIEMFRADDIEMFNSDTIQPYKAEIIEQYQAQPIEKYESIATIDKYEAEIAKLNPPGALNVDIPVGGFSSPDYNNPLVQAWTAHMNALPYLMNNNMTYRY